MMRVMFLLQVYRLQLIWQTYACALLTLNIENFVNVVVGLPLLHYCFHHERLIISLYLYAT
jgi:hypothetical protein